LSVLETFAKKKAQSISEKSNQDIITPKQATREAPKQDTSHFEEEDEEDIWDTSKKKKSKVIKKTKPKENTLEEKVSDTSISLNEVVNFISFHF